MNEEDLHDQIKVIATGLTYHWRDGGGGRLCGNSGDTPVMTLKEAIGHNLGVCRMCKRVAEAMAKGWDE